MTKKHYEAIAGILKKARINATKQQHYMVDVIICDLAAAFAQSNPCFDKYKFYKACGIDQ
jgi:capsule polysaccharide export protein KpsE/RkpR